MNEITSTPLRYPGGKSIFTNFFKDFIESNFSNQAVYAEPYCGGAGVAINFLKEKIVKMILLNDADIAIYAFWYSLKNHGKEFLDMFDNTPVTLKEWHKERLVYKDNRSSKDGLLKKGFATFFLNRCNRSGILSAGPIGGQNIASQEKAIYKLDARYNQKPLRDKLISIINNADGIEVYNLDAMTFLKNRIQGQSLKAQLATFVYLDPPYYCQGSSLYLNYYNKSDHDLLSEYLKNDEIKFRWILSYDNVTPIKNSYKDFRTYMFYINYSAQNNKLGSELLIASNNSELPVSMIIKKFKNKKTMELIVA
jgi:DNA adenine methylase